MKLKIVCLMLALASVASAVPITGSLGFTGAFTSNNPDLTLATTLSPSGVVTTGIADGNFSAIPNGTAVVMIPSLTVNQPGVTLPGSPIWSVGGFSLLLTSIFEQPGNTVDSISLKGFGLISGGAFDPTPGSWIGTFNSAGTNFTFSASSTATPDGGSLVLMLGIGTLALVAFGRIMPRQACVSSLTLSS